MNLYQRDWSKTELMRRLGSLPQAGGVQLLRYEDGPATGVRMLEFRLGSGFIFKVALDRGMDVGYCEYKGMPLGWIPPTLLPGPWHFEQQTEFGWLRTAMGGLCTSCGLLHIGNPESDSIAHYNFPGRQEERYGVHDRLAMLPAQLLNYGETWEGDECWLNASGKIVQAQVYAENLVVHRTYTARMGEKRFFMRDHVINEGYYPTPMMLLYHLNFGFPFIDEGSQLLSSLSQPARMLVGGKELIDSGAYAVFTAPKSGANLEVFELQPNTGRDGTAGIAIIQPGLGESGMGVYLRYKPEQFPKLFETRMMGEGHYFVSLEPGTNEFGRAELRRRGEMNFLHPGERREFELEIGVLEGHQEIEAFH
jgi:hypothetical protein